MKLIVRTFSSIHDFQKTINTIPNLHSWSMSSRQLCGTSNDIIILAIFESPDDEKHPAVANKVIPIDRQPGGCVSVPSSQPTAIFGGRKWVAVEELPFLAQSRE